MKTVKINREFIETFYFCPQLAYLSCFGKKQIFDVNKNKINFNKLSDFTDEFYKHKIYSKILTYIFFKHKEICSIDYDTIVNLTAQMLLEERAIEKRYEKYDSEILENVKNIIKMFNQKDSIILKYNTIKDELDLSSHIESYFDFSRNVIYEEALLKCNKKFIYEIEIPFILVENNSSLSCVPVIFTNKTIEDCNNVHDVNAALIMSYIKENSFYKKFDKVVFYDFKNFKRTEAIVDYNKIPKVKEIAKILSQMVIKNYVKQLESNKCAKCGNFVFCQNYGISRGT